MKKFILFISGLLVILLSSVALLSWYTGKGVRLYDGRYLGYSIRSDEWLIFQYQNIPVRQDGPYVFNDDKSKRYAIYIHGDGDKPTIAHRKQIKDRVEVIVDNEQGTRFIVPFREKHSRSPLRVPRPERLLAISDIEGEFDSFVQILSANGVLDDSLNWAYGNGQLVLIGDMVDRGTNVLPTLWLIYKLEEQARIAGGAVHYVLGNHEQYLLEGRTKSVAKKYYGSFRATGLSQQELWSENSELGQWLRSKPALLQIGETLFVHGGISPKVLSAFPNLERVDSEAAEWIGRRNLTEAFLKNSLLYGSDGLLFYRGLAKDMSRYGLGGKADNTHVQNLLRHFGVKRIAIGHSLVENISFDFNGQVLRVNVHHSGGNSEALLFEGESLWRVDATGKKYSLKQVKKLDG